MKKFNVGVLGCTGMVGQRFVTLLENHPWFNLCILAASSRSAGLTYENAVDSRWSMNVPIPARYRNMVVLDAQEDMNKIAAISDFVFCAVDMPKEDIKILEESYARAECPVISNNSAHRFTPDVPMIIPELNPEHTDIIDSQRKRLNTRRGFIAVKSNCSLQSYIPAIHPLLDLGVDKILVCTYQAISGAGKTFSNWGKMIDNLIPYIGGEEEKSETEPLKIWGKVSNDIIIPNTDISITSQCIRVPVSDGHMAAVFISFKGDKPDKKTIIERWNDFDCGVKLPSSPKKFLRYSKDNDRPQIKLDRDIDNGMAVSLGRLRKDSQYDYKFIGLSHNTIRGAAGGSILMAEMLVAQRKI